MAIGGVCFDPNNEIDLTDYKKLVIASKKTTEYDSLSGVGFTVIASNKKRENWYSLQGATISGYFNDTSLQAISEFNISSINGNVYLNFELNNNYTDSGIWAGMCSYPGNRAQEITIYQIWLEKLITKSLII